MQRVSDMFATRPAFAAATVAPRALAAPPPRG